MSASFWGGLTLCFSVTREEFLVRERGAKKVCKKGHEMPDDSGPFCSQDGTSFELPIKVYGTPLLKKLWNEISKADYSERDAEGHYEQLIESDEGPIFSYDGRLYVGVSLSHLSMFGGDKHVIAFGESAMAAHWKEVQALRKLLGMEDRQIYIVNWISGSS